MFSNFAIFTIENLPNSLKIPIKHRLKPYLSGLAIIPLVKGVPQATSQEDSWPELSFEGPQVPAEFDRDVDDANVTNDAGSLAGFGRSSSRGSPRNIFFNPDAGYIGKIRVS